MPHTFEPASSGRAKCRGCGRPIAKGQLRFGERMPNAYGEGEMTLWFHVPCGALKRPEPWLQTLEGSEGIEVDNLAWLRHEAQRGLQHRRLPRVDGAERAKTGRARCRSCRELIAKGAWRIGLVYYEEGRFEPSGYIHAGCAQAYFEVSDLGARVQHFCPDLSADELEDLEEALRTPNAPANA